MQSGVTQLLAENLAAPTGIAVGRDKTVYVAQLFGDGVSSVKNGTVVNVLAETGGSPVTMGLRQ